MLSLSADLNSNESTLEGDESAIIVHVFAPFRNTFFSPPFRAFRSFEIDLLSAFGRFGQNSDLIRQDLNKAPGDRQEKPSITFPVPQLPYFQFRKKGRVTRKDAEVSRGARDFQFVHLLVNDRAFRSDDGQI